MLGFTQESIGNEVESIVGPFMEPVDRAAAHQCGKFCDGGSNVKKDILQHLIFFTINKNFRIYIYYISHKDVYLPERIRKRTHCKNDMQVLLCPLDKKSKQLWTTPVRLHRFVELFFQARKSPAKICFLASPINHRQKLKLWTLAIWAASISLLIIRCRK